MRLFSVSIPRVSGKLRPWHRALVAMLAGAAATAGHSQWLQSGYDSAKTYANTAETTLTPSNATSLTVKWQAQLSPFAISATTQADGRIIACSSSLGLSAFDPGTGAVLWSQPMADYDTCKSPALQDGVAYVTTFSNPAVLNTHWFSATDQTSGTLLVSEKREFNPTAYIDDTHPTLAGNRLYLASAAYSIVALDRATGHVVWNNQTIKSAGNRGLSVADGRVFVSTWFTLNCCRPPNEGVFAFDAETGSRLWEYRVKGRNMSQLPMALGGNVYVGDSEGVPSWAERQERQPALAPAIERPAPFTPGGARRHDLRGQL